MKHFNDTTIVAVSTPPGAGGIAVIRLSGPQALSIADRAWSGCRLDEATSHTAHFGRISDRNGDTLDEAVATVFRAPRSYTGEDTVEFAVHGSRWIQGQVTARLVELGATPAGPGEFTRRAYTNGRLDLAQAEAVADLIASSSRAAHKLAIRQMSGTFSRRLESLRESLVHLASMLELELDFSEEDVEFADRTRLLAITDETLSLVASLASTYDAGRAFKEGVPVVIAGTPNAGKSTLLNLLLGEDKAIVSDIPGTTRDIIEDTVEIGGILFRLYDTAGLRDTTDRVERIGIDRAREALGRAAITLWLIDPTTDTAPQYAEMQAHLSSASLSHLIVLQTKADLTEDSHSQKGDGEGDPGRVRETDTQSAKASKTGGNSGHDAIRDEACNTDGDSEPVSLTISSKTGKGIERLRNELVEIAIQEHNPDADLIITNARHHALLRSGEESLKRARQAITDGYPADLIAQDVREALHHLGQITGAVTTDTLLTTIFTRFCVGK